MSNLEKAAEIVYIYGQTTFERSLFVARALSAEGLLATAPDTAEVVRLREELEALRRSCIESAEVSERNAEVAYNPDPYVAVEEAERDTADIITRILEGTTTEVLESE